jgi:hypothetical protein
MRPQIIFPISLLSLIIIISLPYYTKSYADQLSVSQKETRSEVIKIFKKAIDLNEDYKSTQDKITFYEYLEKRGKLEEFDEEILAPRLSDCAKLLSSGKDIVLATQFFNLLISYQNSADEQLSFTLGEIFQNNPELVIETFKVNTYNETDQSVLYRYIEWGWVNIICGRKVSESIFRDRKHTLEKLHEEIRGSKVDILDIYRGLQDKVIIITDEETTK